jgi:hypothetical protein
MQPASRLRPSIDLRPGATAHRRVSLAIVPLLALIVSFLMTHDALAAGGTIGNGDNVTGSIVTGQVDVWTFTANQGDSVWVTASEANVPSTAFVPRIDVIAPDGSTDVAANFNALFARVTFRASQTGTYTIKVQQQTVTNVVGNYVLTLAKAPGAFVVPAGDDGGPIDNGANVTGSLFRGDEDVWSFAANQGDSIWVSASQVGTNSAFVPRIDVYGPDGVDEAANFNDLFARVTFRAPSSGTYTIVVQQQTVTDLAGLTYVLRLAKAPGAFVVPAGDEGGTIVANATVPGSIARGDMDLWSFSATQGNQIEVSASETNSPNTAFVPRIDVYGPDGVDEAANFNDLFARVAFKAPQSGTYTIVVQQQTVTDIVGTYALEMTGAVATTGGPGPGPGPVPPVKSLPAPIRLIDTRTLGAGPIASGTSRCFTVAGVAGIPADAGAVVLNVTAVGYGTNGWLTVYPNGQAVPATSTLNFDTSEYAMANGSMVRIGSDGQVCVNVGTVNSAAGSSQVILDVTGYLTAAGLAQLPMLASPQRVVDTRTNGGPVAAGQSRCFVIAGLAGIPSSVSALVLNVTAVGYGRQGWLVAYPAGQAVPATSALNFDTTEYAMANGAVMAVGSGGQVCVGVGTVNNAPGSAHIIIDVVGYL